MFELLLRLLYLPLPPFYPVYSPSIFNWRHDTTEKPLEPKRVCVCQLVCACPIHCTLAFDIGLDLFLSSRGTGRDAIHLSLSLLLFQCQLFIELDTENFKCSFCGLYIFYTSVVVVFPGLQSWSDILISISQYI